MQAGGAWTELGSYPAFVIGKLLGTDPRRIVLLLAESLIRAWMCSRARNFFIPMQ